MSVFSCERTIQIARLIRGTRVLVLTNNRCVPSLESIAPRFMAVNLLKTYEKCPLKANPTFFQRASVQAYCNFTGLKKVG